MKANNGFYAFPEKTIINAYYWEELKDNELVSLELNGNNEIIIVTYVDSIRETDNLREFSFSEIKKIANFVLNE